ncbi:YebY family protein [Photorhabdus sp. SF281]|uniref:YebY family protein n=1 Tax=Photorhabdus sp. SF281 TaxID=3459527 RepID=UPI00404462F6
MKRLFLLLPLFSLSFQNVAAPIETVSKLQFGDKWAFTREEVMLDCRANRALFVINPSTLVQYPLNDIATEMMRIGKVNAKSLDIILLNDSKNPAQKMSIEPFQQAALSLCDKK